MEPGLYRIWYEDAHILAFVCAVGQQQLMYMTIDYPIVTKVTEISYFESIMRCKLNYRVDKAARKLLETTPARTGQITDKAKAILEDLGGVHLLD